MANLFLYLLTQNVNRGYDTYASCVVCAESEEEDTAKAHMVDRGAQTL